MKLICKKIHVQYSLAHILFLQRSGHGIFLVGFRIDCSVKTELNCGKININQIFHKFLVSQSVTSNSNCERLRDSESHETKKLSVWAKFPPRWKIAVQFELRPISHIIYYC